MSVWFGFCSKQMIRSAHKTLAEVLQYKTNFGREWQLYGTKLYKQLLDNLTTAVMLIDDRFSLVYMNPAAEMLLEASERRLFHVPVRQWLMLGDEDWELAKRGTGASATIYQA